MRPIQLLTRALLALMLALVLPFAAAGVPNDRAQPAYAEEQTILQAESDARRPQPGLDNAASGRVHVDRHYLGEYGGTEGTVIIQRGGNTWRVLRNGPMATIMGALLVLALIAIFLFYQVIGPIRTNEPDTGRPLLRFNSWERLIHWSTAIAFLVLAFTGLIIMFGKKLLMPWMGHDVFSAIAYLSKYLHNFAGPLFIVCSILLFATFLSRNFYNHQDMVWFKKSGGMFSHTHVKAGFFNAGEKTWFWLGLTTLGLIMSVSGLILDFVTFGQTRYVLQVANYVHIAGATIYMITAMGHIYIGTIGTPGAYHGMRYGTVDEAWARAHHEGWYEEVKSGAAPEPRGPDTTPPVGRPGPAH